MADSENEFLRSAAASFGLFLGDDQLDQLLGYVDLLEKWNRTYNLTAIRNREEMIVRHVLESLAIAPLIQGSNRLDVGTGAGIPGIPLAIADANHRYTLLDSNGKKTRFIQNAVMELQLHNVVALNDRVENVQGEFGLITARAFSSLGDMLALTKKTMLDDTLLVAMKGVYPEDELDDLKASKEFKLMVEKSEVPFLNEERHLVLVRNARD